VLLAGRVTEHLVFGQITTGASDDLRKVHDISRSMVTQYGMGTELQSKQLPADDYSMSDNTRRMIDEEQQYLTDLAHRRAIAIVEGNRALLEAFASTLLENEVLERDDIDVLMAGHHETPAGNGSRPSAVAASERLEPEQGASLDQPGTPPSGGSSPSQ
jgi:cell division protease FtsH